MMQIQVVDNVFLRTSTQPGTAGDVWFLHGFGACSAGFTEAFSSVLARKFNLYALDFPGFGVSPLIEGKTSLRDSLQVSMNLIQQISNDRQVYIVAHSLGGIIGTWVCQELSDQIGAFFNIEGNLTRADAFVSGLVVNYESAEEFHQGLWQMVYDGMRDNIVFRRYYASLWQARPQALEGWGRSAVELSNQENAGREFSELACKTLYYWGRNSTATETQEFLQANHIPNQEYQNAGHSPMVEQPEQCYKDILDFFTS